MKPLKKLKPEFWDHHATADDHAHSGLNFARKWKMIVFFTSFMALLPLVIMAVIEFNMTRQVILDEVKNNMAILVASAAASIDAERDSEEAARAYINRINPDENNDIFIVRPDGILLTPSFYFGRAGSLPAFSSNRLLESERKVLDSDSLQGNPVIIAYDTLSGSGLKVVHARSREKLARLWFKPRLKLIGYLIVSIIIILLSIMGTATYLVGRIHRADRRRSEALHHAEHANKLASIGRLASGVAHEINNPLAIINQKAGLIVDLLSIRQDTPEDDRLAPLANDIVEAVRRCGNITRQLLDFARDMELNIQVLDIREVISQVLAFLKSEADHKAIAITLNIDDTIQGFECDRGSLQQIFLNLFNNAFAAMGSGGKLDISVCQKKGETVVITVSDNGCGIANQNITKIFEPFYKSEDDHFSTGMGLSITYGLVRGIGGTIRVKSKVGEGTCFTVTLPLKAASENGSETRNPDQEARSGQMGGRT